jgi:hypothetical protein
VGQAPATTGVDFRAIEGRRSSQRASQDTWSTAVAGSDGALAARIRNERDWRRNYIEHVRSVVIAGTAGPKNALQIANDGLMALRNNVAFRGNGDDMSLTDALAHPTASVRTEELAGRGTRIGELTLPYRGTTLHGDELRRQLESPDAAVRD